MPRVVETQSVAPGQDSDDDGKQFSDGPHRDFTHYLRVHSMNSLSPATPFS